MPGTNTLPTQPSHTPSPAFYLSSPTLKLGLWGCAVDEDATESVRWLLKNKFVMQFAVNVPEIYQPV